jgi:hypothetical protein
MLLATLFSTLELMFLKSILALQEIGCFLSSRTSSYLIIFERMKTIFYKTFLLLTSFQLAFVICNQIAHNRKLKQFEYHDLTIGGDSNPKFFESHSLVCLLRNHTVDSTKQIKKSK